MWQEVLDQLLKRGTGYATSLTSNNILNCKNLSTCQGQTKAYFTPMSLASSKSFVTPTPGKLRSLRSAASWFWTWRSTLLSPLGRKLSLRRRGRSWYTRSPRTSWTNRRVKSSWTYHASRPRSNGPDWHRHLITNWCFLATECLGISKKIGAFTLYYLKTYNFVENSLVTIWKTRWDCAFMPFIAVISQ